MVDKNFIRIVVTSLPIYECIYYMAGKNIEKYHLWLWSSLVKILDLLLVAFKEQKYACSHIEFWIQKLISDTRRLPKPSISVLYCIETIHISHGL